MYSLHPVTTELVAEFLMGARVGPADDAVLTRAAQGMKLLQRGDSRGPDMVTHALATYLSRNGPVFASADVSLSGWEASIDRGVGMLLRPPSRMFVDAGMDRAESHVFPIRLDTQRGSMAGAFVPSHLIPALYELLDGRLDRQVRRLREAEIDPVVAMAEILQAVRYARDAGTGLLEAMDVLPTGEPNVQIVAIRSRREIEPELRDRLENAAKPTKNPGIFGRLLGRSQVQQMPTEQELFDAWRDEPKGMEK